MSSHKLKNAPLKEVIFELHWEADQDESGLPADKGFEFAVGSFAEKLKADFPFRRKLPQAIAPLQFIGVPLHQYWKGEGLYPVVQHGKCMLAVNDTEKEYVWLDSFRPLILQSIERLTSSYDEPLKFNKAVLKYVDAADMDGMDPHEFMRTNLQTSIHNHYTFPGELMDAQLVQSFNLGNESIMRLAVATGINNKNDQKAVIWSTAVEIKTNLSQKEISEWIDFAHDHSSKMFKTMLQPEYYGSLDG